MRVATAGILLVLTGCASLFRQAGEELTEGAATAMARHTEQEDLDLLARRLAVAVARAGEAELTPTLERDVRRVVSAALDEVLAAERTGAVEAFATALIRRLTAEVVGELDAGARTRLAPAVEALVREQLAPAIEAAVRDRVGPATVQMVADLTVAMGEELGAAMLPGGPLAEALDWQRAETVASLEAAYQRQLGHTAGVADTFTQRALGAAGASVLGLVGLVAWACWAGRAHRDKATRYERALEVVTAAIHGEASRGGSAGALVEALRAQDRAALGPKALEAFLDDRPHLKVAKRG